jgi:hypothetical protein
MKPGSNRVGSQLACKRDFAVAQAANFTHQKDVTVDGAQAVQGFSKCECQRLCRRRRRVAGDLDRLTASSIVAHMVEREIPRDAKEPGAAAPFIGLRDCRTCHSQEYLLRQLTRVFTADDSAQVAEDAFPVRGEEDVGICHRCDSIC